jgi:hypothetical protein
MYVHRLAGLSSPEPTFSSTPLVAGKTYTLSLNGVDLLPGTDTLRIAPNGPGECNSAVTASADVTFYPSANTGTGLINYGSVSFSKAGVYRGCYCKGTCSAGFKFFPVSSFTVQG